ncbi:OstA-like protein [Neotamlana nanhaiensis]|uniref:OstA-like protein n=1 Tax=Neotamlana nanhaiensis TaxID=1382798 RepID=UPI0005CC5918|nr:OstA-like protein [Tamlana nanhaiensis]
MNTLQVLFLAFVFSFISVSNTFSQENKKIEIEYAGKLTIDEANYPGAKILTRDDAQQVLIHHQGTHMWCDKAIHYGKEDFIEAYGNVKLIQGDTINMTSKYIEYSGLTELAFAHGDVVLKDPNSTITTDTLYYDKLNQQAFYRTGGTVVKDSSGTITSKIGRYYMNMKKYQFVEDVVLANDSTTVNSNYFDFYSDSGHAYLFGPSTITNPESKTYCEKGFYDTKNKTGYAVKNSKIHYDNRIVEGDSLYFDNNKSFASATNNIKVTDTLNNSIIKGHYAEVYKAKDSVFITKRALAITVQENDSIYMHADKIMVTGKPENRIVNAYYNAKIYKSDISGKSDSIYSNQKTGLTKLINISKLATNDKFSTKRKPILWNYENQMTGDTIHLISNNETEKLDSLLVFNNAFVISQDTISKTGFNQIKGLSLVGLFNDENQLRQVDITKNAESIIWARDDQQALIGIDKAKSGSITMLFANGDIEEYTRFNQVDGTLSPESKSPEKERILKDFDWREDERPLSVEDLFKDDPPFELPIIKGLEDYVPQDVFFNDEMMGRIELAGKMSPHLLNNVTTKLNKDISNKNLLQFFNDFNNPKWAKHQVKVESNSISAPNGALEATKIVGTGSKNGYFYQVLNKTKGKFAFSIWLKGKGDISMVLQEASKDYTWYKTSKIKLTNYWKNYTIETEKESDNQKLRCVLAGIQETDELYVWNSNAEEITEDK